MNKNYKSIIASFAIGSLLLSFSASAQSFDLESTNATFINDLGLNNKLTATNKSITNCGADTLTYPLLKATGLAALGLNNATSASSASQYFNASDTVIVSGGDFYAWKTDLTGGTSLTMNAAIYLAAADSTPLGTPLAIQAVTVDTTFGGGALTSLQKSFSFTSPVMVTQPYVIVISNNSATPASILTNSWTAGNGRVEWLSSALLGTNWVRGYSLNVGGFAFNADFLFHPHVSYNLETDFTLNPNQIITAPATVAVNNNSSWVISDRMYNRAVALGAAGLIHTYNYGNGGGDVKVTDSNVVFQNAQNYTITLTDSLFTYNNGVCDNIETKVLSAQSVGLEELTTNNDVFSFYPNPAQNQIIIELNEDLSNQNDLSILGINGEVVFEQNITSKKTTVNLEEFAKGIYFVKINNKISKLVITK